MTASKRWQASASPAALYLLRLYVYIMRLLEFMRAAVYAGYLWSVGTVFNNEVTDVYFYNFDTQTRQVVFTHSNPLWVFYLMFLKFVLHASINDIVNPGVRVLPFGRGIFEINFFQKGDGWRKVFTREYTEDPPAEQRQVGTYLYASVNGTYSVTSFINNNLSSFNNLNAFTADDIVRLCYILLGKLLPTDYDDFEPPPSRLYLIEDETLNEIFYEGEQPVVLLA